MNQASATYPAMLLLILLALALLPAVAADPAVVDGGGGIKLATWDFSTPGDYNATGVAFAPGTATLALTPRWTNDTSDAEFLASEDSATNVSVNSGLRLVNQARSLIQDGAFNQTVGPWTYANGSTGQVVSARDPGGSARLWHLTPRVQFDSMDSVFGTHPWTAVSNGKSSSALSQSTFVRKEGTGSLRDDITIGQQGGGNWVGAIRDDPARVAQTFMKPDPTNGSPGTLSLQFDVSATPSVNVVSYLKVNLGGFTWSESPVAAGARTLSFDASADPALQGTGSFNLTFSLELIRIGTQEASMSAWIDNVTLIAREYHDGSFTRIPIDAGSTALWRAADVQSTSNPPATSVAAETRTGNSSSPGDSSWTPWQTLAGSQIASPPNRFLQWRLSLTTDGASTPTVTRFSLRAETYALAGILPPAPFLPREPLTPWVSFSVKDARPLGTSILYEVSVDGGATWTQAADGQDLSW